MAHIISWLIGGLALFIAHLASAPFWVFALIIFVFFGVFIISCGVDLDPFD